MQATINVQYVNQPKQPGWSGSVKTKDGQIFGVKEIDLKKFSPGQTYNIEFVERAKEGKVYRDFVRFTDSQAPAKEHHGPFPPPQPNGHAAASHNTLDKDKLIFVTGVVGRAMGSGKFDLSQIRQLTAAAVQAWAALTE